MSHPRIWSFIETFNNTNYDAYLDIEGKSNGIDITRNRKLIDIQENETFRRDCRNKLEAGEYTLIQYLFIIDKSVQPATNGLSEQSDVESLSDFDEIEILVGDCQGCRGK